MISPMTQLRFAAFIYGIVVFLAPAPADENLAGRACRSVHWGYETSPSTAFYNEVTIDRTAPGTYFCVCGFNKGYYGLQELADGKHLLIFSVWDPGKQDDPNSVNDEQRVKLLYRDDAVRVGRFGGEGTGGQSFFDYDWKLGATYRLLVTARVDGRWTEFSGWFFVPEDKQWRKLVTFATLAGGKALDGGYSFVEDFRRNGESAKLTRTAQFGNGWLQTLDKDWRPITTARFTADGNPATNINATVRAGRFLLSTGGDVKNDDLPLRTRVELPAVKDADPPADMAAICDPNASHK
jgi:hypothetical protein